MSAESEPSSVLLVPKLKGPSVGKPIPGLVEWHLKNWSQPPRHQTSPLFRGDAVGLRFQCLENLKEEGLVFFHLSVQRKEGWQEHGGSCKWVHSSR